MHWRPFRETDLLFCLKMQPDCLGDAIVGRAQALGAWKALVKHDAFLATVIEAPRVVAGNTIVGCGMGVFVRRSFADAELASPRAGLNARILANGDVLLTRAEIGAGNAGQGLDFVNLYGTWRDGVMTPEELADVQVLLGVGFAEQFGGYRFHRVLKEAVGEDRIALARATGTYRIVAEFAESKSALAVVTRESAQAAPYSVAASIYRYKAPVLRLRPAEQELLLAAIGGKTDAELSAELGLRVEATKRRWLSVFDRVAQYKPEILSASDAEGEGRGRQKRHRIVAYVRDHPEELRPYAWRVTKR